jgi:hypothetical protein
MSKRLAAVTLIALTATLATTVAVAPADPGSSNPKAQYRTFSCDNGVTYSNAVFVGFASGSFLLSDSTDVFAIKVFSEYTAPGGELIATFNYGIPGFDSSSLITCSYTDPEGIYNVFSGFITPRP